MQGKPSKGGGVGISVFRCVAGRYLFVYSLAGFLMGAALCQPTRQRIVDYVNKERSNT